MVELDRRTVLTAMSAASLGGLVLAGCSAGGSSSGSSSSPGSSSGSSSGSLTLDHGAWSYDADNDVYWQVGLSYAASPQAPDIETLGVFVPGAYVSATDNGDGTFTATVDPAGKVGGFTAATAPIVLPVNTPGYAAQQPPSEYSYDTVSAYLAAGFVYVAAGMRGRDSSSSSYDGNAPWGVTDLKAAVRFLRVNAELIPGDTDSMFVFGMSGGGAQSSVMGAAGDSALFEPYLTQLGAAMSDADGNAISDAVAGVMAWCPITSLDWANAAYEWNLGQFATTGTRAAGTWTKAYSEDLAAAYAGYVNDLQLVGPAGRRLSLATSRDGTFISGSYYDHVLAVVERSLNDFLADTTFPYTPTTDAMGGMGTGGGGTPPSGEAPSGGTMPSDGAAASSGAASSNSASSTTYDTVRDYIDHLNSDGAWVDYDASSGKATVLSLAGFVTSQKPPTKDVGAFDSIDRSATENVVLGLGEDGLHFAEVSHDVIAANQDRYATLSGWDAAYGADQYASDFAESDDAGQDVLTRVDAYNPMYFLSDHYDGYQSSNVAPHWRIRTGIMQGDTASTIEINLALALANLGIKNVDFATVWGQAHTMAERTGDATTNFIAWVTERVGG